MNQPVLVTNWSQYVNTFGSLEEGGRRNPHMPRAYLSHAVYGYFLNGGGRCYVTRVAPQQADGDRSAQLRLPSRSSKAVASLILAPKGTPTQDIQVEVAPPTTAAGPGEEQPPAPEGAFTLRIRMGNTEEVHENVSFGRRGAKNVVETLTQNSQLVTVVEEMTTGSLVERAPDTGRYTLKSPQPSLLPQVRSNNFTGDVSERSGMEGLEIA